MTRREIEDYLIERAMIEPEFRKALIAEPGQLLRGLGLPVGEDVEIRVFEEKPKSFFLVLPRALREEIDEAELEQMAGGHPTQTDMSRFFKGYA